MLSIIVIRIKVQNTPLRLLFGATWKHWVYETIIWKSLYPFFRQVYHSVQYSSQVTSRVHALRGMRAREKLARVQGRFEELRAKPKSPESSTIANLPERLLLRVLAQS